MLGWILVEAYSIIDDDSGGEGEGDGTFELEVFDDYIRGGVQLNLLKVLNLHLFMR